MLTCFPFLCVLAALSLGSPTAAFAPALPAAQVLSGGCLSQASLHARPDFFYVRKPTIQVASFVPVSPAGEHPRRASSGASLIKAAQDEIRCQHRGCWALDLFLHKGHSYLVNPARVCAQLHQEALQHNATHNARPPCMRPYPRTTTFHCITTL